MIIVELKGGLGNQLFQYAAALALAIKHKSELKVDIRSLQEPDEILNTYRKYMLHNLNKPPEIANEHEINKLYKKSYVAKILNNLSPFLYKNYFKEQHFEYHEEFQKLNGNVYLKGNWQSEKYFSQFKNQVINSLGIDRFCKNPKPINSLISESKIPTVSVHIRRGDYLKNQIANEVLGVLPLSYYQTAIQQLQQHYADLQLFYFSDDPEWVRQELLPQMPGTIVSSPDFTQYEDFYLMSHCKHNVIANSSFSWWAAYLNPNPHKTVIAPKNWFNKAPYNTKDLYPDGWIKL